MVSTDGRTDRRTDTEGYNIIPRHTLVAGYKNHKATKPAFNVGPLLACQRNAISMVFPLRTDDGISILSPSHQLKKHVSVGPPLTKLSGSTHESSGWKGVLSFFSIHSLGCRIYCLPKLNFRNIRHTIKILEILATPKKYSHSVP